MLGVKTIKKLSKNGKLKLQSKLENDSLNIKSNKVKKIIIVAIMSLAVGGLCYTYLPSRRLILTIGSRIFKSKSINCNAELNKPKNPTTRDQITIVLLSTMVLALVKLSLVHSTLNVGTLDNIQESETYTTIEDNPSSLVAGMVIFTTIWNILVKLAGN